MQKNYKEKPVNDEGYVKLHREIIASWVFANPICLKIWLWCNLRASYKKRYIPFKVGNGNITIEILSGQFIFGRRKASEEINIKESTIYNWIKKLEKKNLLTIKSNNNYSVITICDWETLQSAQDNVLASDEQPINELISPAEQLHNTNKKDKKVNQDNKDNNVSTLSKNDLIVRQANFKTEVAQFTNYSETMLKEFYDYWSEPNHSKTKMRMEMEKTWDLVRRLRTWKSRDLGFKSGTNGHAAKLKSHHVNDQWNR